MTKIELHKFFIEKGWSLKAPHYIAYHSDKSPQIRYKLQKLVLRKERLISKELGWVRVASAYVSKLKINEEGRLYGWERS